MVKTLLKLDQLKKTIKSERGEGMVGWIVAAMLTITIVTLIHGLTKGWLETFWKGVQDTIENLV